MLSFCRRAARRDDRPSFGEGDKIMPRSEDRPSLGEGDKIMPRDEALERFDQLRVREAIAEDYHTAAFLAQFQSIAASLEPDERIKLEVAYPLEGVKLLKAVLADPQASKICSLHWWYNGKKGVNSIVPLLTNNCPELASLRVDFWYHSAFDFVSSVLEHPSNKIKVLEMSGCPKGDSARFFAALGRSQVSALALSLSPKSVQGLHEYVAKDLLVRLEAGMDYKQVPHEMMMSLVKCTRLAKLKLAECEFSQSTAFPKSITKLVLHDCTFAGGFDWSFLADSKVRELDFDKVKGVDGNRLGGALAVHLRAKGLDTLCFFNCLFVNETLAAVGLGVGRNKRLEVDDHLNDASTGLISLALQSPNSELRELVLSYGDDAVSSIENHLVPASKHPKCNLTKLSLRVLEPELEAAAKTIEDMFYNRLALFALLQGQRVRGRYYPLRRLPVEMFRLVGMALI
ncbi:hypothetical protein BASA81_000589 [Batrachochytrium salamandrivorans]|nr:hypothetical protein BASA81_000589 [Batrachochytrium salamandrivorans]